MSADLSTTEPNYLKEVERFIQLRRAFTLILARQADKDLEDILKICTKLGVKLEIDPRSDRDAMDWIIAPTILGTYGFIKGGLAAGVMGSAAPDLLDGLTGIPFFTFVKLGAYLGAAIGVLRGLSATHWGLLIRAKQGSYKEIGFQPIK